MFVVGSLSLQSEFYVFGVNVGCWVFYVAIYIVESFRWQCVLLYVLGGNVCCCMFYVAICFVGSFR